LLFFSRYDLPFWGLVGVVVAVAVIIVVVAVVNVAISKFSL